MQIPDEMEPEILIVDEHLALHGPDERFIDPMFATITRHRAWLAQSMNWPGAVNTRADVERTIRANILMHQRGYSKMYLVLADEQLVGVISFNQIEPTNKTAYIGYWRSPECPQKGVISRGLQRLMAHYSASGVVRRFVIKCIVDNAASNRLAQRNGFTLEGRLREAEYLNGRFHDQHIYGLIVDPQAQPDA